MAASLTPAPSGAEQVLWGPPSATAMGCGTFVHFGGSCCKSAPPVVIRQGLAVTGRCREDALGRMPLARSMNLRFRALAETLPGRTLSPRFHPPVLSHPLPNKALQSLVPTSALRETQAGVWTTYQRLHSCEQHCSQPPLIASNSSGRSRALRAPSQSTREC